MNQYILLIENNVKTSPSQEEWDLFFKLARESGYFRGGSALGEREIIGDKASAQSTDFIAGYMNFDCNDRAALVALLEKHPVYIHGGSIHLCEMPKT